MKYKTLKAERKDWGIIKKDPDDISRDEPTRSRTSTINGPGPGPCIKPGL